MLLLRRVVQQPFFVFFEFVQVRFLLSPALYVEYLLRSLLLYRLLKRLRSQHQGDTRPTMRPYCLQIVVALQDLVWRSLVFPCVHEVGGVRVTKGVKGVLQVVVRARQWVVCLLRPRRDHITDHRRKESLVLLEIELRPRRRCLLLPPCL